MFSIKPDARHGQDSVIALDVTMSAWVSLLVNALEKSEQMTKVLSTPDLNADAKGSAQDSMVGGFSRGSVSTE